jgi:hypothetical protein
VRLRFDVLLTVQGKKRERERIGERAYGTTELSNHHDTRCYERYPCPINPLSPSHRFPTVGSVLWLANTSRPDIAHGASLLSRALGKWNEDHYEQAINLLRYLAGTRDLVLAYTGSSSSPALEGQVDADWAGDLETRRSTTGYVMRTFGGVSAWKSARQPSVALSTTEAEFIAPSKAASEILFLRRFLDKLDLLPTGPTPLQNDNMGAIALSTSPYNHDSTKHIDLRRHFLRETVKDKIIDLTHIPGKDNVADFFTKSLPEIDFERLNASPTKGECWSLVVGG